MKLVFKKKGKCTNCLAPPQAPVSYSKVHYCVCYLYPVGSRIQLMTNSKWTTFQELAKNPAQRKSSFLNTEGCITEKENRCQQVPSRRGSRQRISNALSSPSGRF